MPTVQWQQIPFALETPAGGGGQALPFNAFIAAENPVTALSAQTGPQWMLVQDGCQAGSAKRVARDNSPQKGGEIVHRKYRTGLVMQLQAIAVNVTVADYNDDGSGDVRFEPACDDDLVDLFDLLMLHLSAIENSDGRLTWLPSGKIARMQDASRWLGSDGQGGAAFTAVNIEFEDETFVAAQFALLCPFPYAMDAPQTTTALGGSTPVVVNNDGTSEFFPVIQVFGPTSAFEIRRTAARDGSVLSMFYSAAFPLANPIPSGQFIEFDFFREVAYFNGDGANAKPGIDVENSDFWSLLPGDNTVEVFGASAQMLWQPAWTG